MSSMVAVKRHPFFMHRKKLAQIGSIPPILTIQILMDVSGLYEQTAEELFCVLVFVWSRRSEV